MNSIPSCQKNHSLFCTVKARLIYTYEREPSINELRQLAEKIHIENKIPITRDIKRSKELLICWMCENWSIVQNYLRMISYNYIQDPNHIIRFSKCSSEKKKKLLDEIVLRDKMIEIEDKLKIIFNKKKLKMSELREISDEICKRSNLQLNRNEKRDKFANIAWFTKNWETIKPIIDKNCLQYDLKNENQIELKKDISNDNKSLYMNFNDFSENEDEENFFQEFLSNNNY